MKLRYGYLLSGILTGLVLLFSFIWTLPDGKLHVVFCDVGQGDAAYIRFPDGRDMVIDGGPNNRVLDCLGRHMPFWDRSIDLVVLTHPQKDHMQGIIPILSRYSIGHLLRSDVGHTSEGYATLEKTIKDFRINERFLTKGDQIVIGATTLTVLWPSDDQVAKASLAAKHFASSQKTATDERVLGVQTGDLNDYSLVQLLQYGSFEVLFTGDADSRVEQNYTGMQLGKRPVEVLKVPHHGSKTGMTKEFVEWVRPQVAVVSVGKNSYGHPSSIALNLLRSVSANIIQTIESGDIEIVSDGRAYSILNNDSK